jgi:potassium voltage-gated channel Eag-related subfamily H protein 8
MLKHLPDVAKNTLLRLLNNMWLSGAFPESWAEATVIPIPKPGKDNTDPNNYRPIALISCVCKTFERMVNDRLVYFLETNNLISEFQSGFRKNRSTVDQQVRFEAFVCEAFIRREHVVSVFFDLEKVHDTTWTRGMKQDLQAAGLQGRLLEFLCQFLSNSLGSLD